MAKRTTKKTTKRTTKKAFTLSENIKALLKTNNVCGVGKVKKVIFENDKVQKFNIELYTLTANDNVSRSWFLATLFADSGEVEQDDVIQFNGYLISNEYNGEWSNGLVIDKFKFIDEDGDEEDEEENPF